MAAHRPLVLRLYSDPLYIELARLIGYQGIPIKEASEKAQPLGERYGKHVAQAAANEISRYDEAKDALVLTDEARKLCWQLLGPPPEHPLYRELHPEPAQEQPHAQAEEKRRQRRPRGRA